MLLKQIEVQTELGPIKTLLVHCDQCGRKMIPDGAMNWLETRRLDRDVPQLHFCSLRCLGIAVQVLLRLGVDAIDQKNWPIILEYCSKAPPMTVGQLGG